MREYVLFDYDYDSGQVYDYDFRVYDYDRSGLWLGLLRSMTMTQEYDSGPLFEKNSLRLIGYFFGLPTKFTFSTDYENLEEFFEKTARLQRKFANTTGSLFFLSYK